MDRGAQSIITFEPDHVIQPISTNGTAALDRAGRILATGLGEDAVLTDLGTGEFIARIEGVSCRTDPSEGVG